MLEAWPDDARTRIEQGIEQGIAAHGRGSAGDDAARPPVAVLDWDNTTARGDIGDLAYAALLDQDLVRWPAEGARAWGALTESAARAIEGACAGHAGPDGRLPTSGESPCGIALAELGLDGSAEGAPAFAPAIGPHYRGSYGMMVRAFAGLSPAEVDALAESTIARALDRPIGARRRIGRAEIDDFVRIQEPVRALVERLRAGGIDVWIVSASFEPVVVAFARRLGIAADHVIGARLERGEDGRYLRTHPYEGALGPLITFDEGKRFWIRHAIFGMPVERALGPTAPSDPRPVIAAGDSDTDHAMLAEASALAILFDRGAPRVTCLARSAPERFVVLPQFVDPRPHAPVVCP